MIRVRHMHKADIDAVYEIECLSFRTPWTRWSLLGELKNDVAVYCLLELDGRVIGYCGLWILCDEAHITNIAIHPALRGKGYGKLLLTAAIKTAVNRDAGRMTLEVREKNTVAQAMYAAFDFAMAGRRKGYYADTGEDAFILWNDTLRETLYKNEPLLDAVDTSQSIF